MLESILCYIIKPRIPRIKLKASKHTLNENRNVTFDFVILWVLWDFVILFVCLHLPW